MKKNILLILVLVILLTFMTACTQKEESEEEKTRNYPQGDITMVVPWGVGGITDIVARVFTPIFEEYIGQSVTIVNMEGASGAIGTEFAYDQEADGYTILFSAETPAVFRLMETSRLGFDNFIPISMVIQDTKLILVPNDSKYRDIYDLIKDIEENPGRVKLAYSAPGASGHLQGLLLKELGLEVSMIPYGGGSPGMIATISGDVDFTFGNYGTVKDYIENGGLRALAIFEAEGFDKLPDLPPMTEIIKASEKYLPLYFPNCIMVKEDTPEEIVSVIEEAVKNTLNDQRWLDFVENQSYTDLSHLSREEIDAYWNDYRSIVSWLLYDTSAVGVNPEDLGIERYKK